MDNAKTTPKATLLLIWAEADASRVARILLEKEGHKVIVSQKPAEGIAQLRKQGDQIRLCIVDLAKATGTEKLYDALARKPANEDVSPDAETLADDEVRDRAIPHLLIVQRDQEGSAAVKASGLVAGYLVKPYDTDDLIEFVFQLLSP